MKILILFLTLFIFFNDIQAQSEYGFECGYLDSSGTLNNSIFGSSFNGLYKPIRTDISGDSASPSGAIFPVIIVFVQFKNDFAVVGVPKSLNTNLESTTSFH